MDGYSLLPLRRAAKIGDIFVTVSGDTSVIRKEHFLVMKEGDIVEQGEGAQVFDNPQTEYTKTLMAAAFDLASA